MISKKYNGYFVLGVLAIIFSLGYIKSIFISAGPNSIPGIYEFIFLLYITPCFSIIYGVISYVLTKQTVIPNLIFAGLFNMLFAVIKFTSDFFKEAIKTLPIGIIIFIISTISSFLTKFIVFRFANHKKEKNSPPKK